MAGYIKRKTRSTNLINNENKLISARSMDSDDENMELPSTKRTRPKKGLINKKLSFDEEDGVSAFNQMMPNPPTDEATYAILQPVSFDSHNNISDLPSSPPPLIIDTTPKTVSQSITSDYFQRSQTIEECMPAQIPFDNNKSKQHPLGSVKQVNDSGSSSSFINRQINECRSANIIREKETVVSRNMPKTINKNQTPTVDRSIGDRFESQIRTHSSNPSVVVSVEQHRRTSNANISYNRRTSTPLRPSHHHQFDSGSAGGYNDSFSVDSIPAETYDVLSRFPEFRRLLKAYYNEKKQGEVWVKDYGSLKKNYERLEQNSFPRPPPIALNYLVEMVTKIQQSNGRGDPRTDVELANDLGQSPMFLLGLKDPSPQQTALNLFNHFYPGYEAKVNLGTINKLETTRPGLLETILVFAQRAAPGVNYKIQDLRDALSNSIRGARYTYRKATGALSHALAVRDQMDQHQVEFEDEDHQNRINEHLPDVYINTNGDSN